MTPDHTHPERNALDEGASKDLLFAQLLQHVGMQQRPALPRSADIEAVVREEWQRAVAAHRRHRTTLWASAASLCALVVGTAIAVRFMAEPSAPFATLERADGALLVAAHDGAWIRVGPGQPIAVGDYLRSDARAVLTLANGSTIRIDRETWLEVVDDDRLALSAGAIYVDSGSSDRDDALTIDTRAGSVRHLGTQYQVRTEPNGMQVSVREGRVLIESASGDSVADAGERVTLSSQGVLSREHIAATDREWRWTTDAPAVFVIENASLAAFLDWISQITGRALVYESDHVRSLAQGEILHGSIEGLTPETALAAVLASSPLTRRETTPEVIEIGLESTIGRAKAPRPTH
jgi:ferric-dicitrate binding protein FerR (iron transport regulator)